MIMPSLKTIPLVLAALAPYIIGIATALIIVAVIEMNQTQYTVKETAAYTRVSNCIVAKSGSKTSTPLGVETCYKQVEKDSHIPLERFDNEISKNNP